MLLPQHKSNHHNDRIAAQKQKSVIIRVCMATCLAVAILVSLLIVLEFSSKIPSPEERLIPIDSRDKDVIHHNHRDDGQLQQYQLNDNLGNSRRKKERKHRIAIVIPYLAAPQSRGVGTNLLPPYTSLFFRSARGCADLLDILIVHDGELTDRALTRQFGSAIPPNVKFINLQSTREFATLLVNRLGDTRFDSGSDNGASHTNKQSVIRTVERYLTKNPYSLVEYKAATGHIFSSYLTNYTHWGYSDMDVVLGDMSRWITKEELEEFDVVTYGYGDQDRVYLRGQFTFHKNNEKVNNLWRACTYLSEIDKRFKSAGRFESAEGCYSHAVLQRKDLRIKYAVKAFTDFESKDILYQHGLYFGIGTYGEESVIYKAGPRDGDGAKLRNLDGTTLLVLQNDQNGTEADETPMQWEVGERSILKTHRDRVGKDVHALHQANCMFWVPRDYQPDLCAPGVTKDDTVFWIDGVLYKQRFENRVLPQNVRSAAFFHFQEWKRSYRETQLSALGYDGMVNMPMHMSMEGIEHPANDEYTHAEALRGWVVLPEGLIPILPRDTSTHNPITNRLHHWQETKRSSTDDRNLPHGTFCLSSSKTQNGRSNRAECNWSVSWTDHDTVYILPPNIHRKRWDTIDPMTGITLVLTLQLSPAQLNKGTDALGPIFDILESNLVAWGIDNPSVLLIHSPHTNEPARDAVLQLLDERFHADRYPHSLVACISSPSGQTAAASRKALLHMAERASPTRWTVSGLDVERGLVLSVEAYLFCQRAADLHFDEAGNVFYVPQFAAASIQDLLGEEYNREKENGRTRAGFASVVDLLRAGERTNHMTLITSDLSSVDCQDCTEVNSDSHDKALAVDDLMYQLWWKVTESELSPPEPNNNAKANPRFAPMDEESISDLVRDLTEIQQEWSELLKSTNRMALQNYDKSPLVMVDALGPKSGMVTSYLVPRVETFGGFRCMNGLELAQLAALGYVIRPLVGAFVLSFTESREPFCVGSDDEDNNDLGYSRCDGCFMFHDHVEVLKGIAREESVRPAKTALLWYENNPDTQDLLRQHSNTFTHL